MGALEDSDAAVAQAAHEALRHVTCQNFGNEGRPWRKWWEVNASRHRIEWLIDALTHDVSEIRRAAGEELRATTREYFGYSSELPPRDRDRTQQRYRDWWITEGRVRFRRRTRDSTRKRCGPHRERPRLVRSLHFRSRP